MSRFALELVLSSCSKSQAAIPNDAFLTVYKALQPTSKREGQTHRAATANESESLKTSRPVTEAAINNGGQSIPLLCAVCSKIKKMESSVLSVFFLGRILPALNHSSIVLPQHLLLLVFDRFQPQNKSVRKYRYKKCCRF